MMIMELWFTLSGEPTRSMRMHMLLEDSFCPYFSSSNFELRQLYSESRSHQKGLVVGDLASSAIRSPEDADSGAKQTIGTVSGGTCRPQERMILTHHFVLRSIRF
uniref:Uncharacterized protein n=1 Tax=Oryza nivara TaxID=4536 RepID=A0A0E0HNF2_ORYNI